ncbi:MAG: lycopene cyclase family protein, partial [Cyanobacteria bacterium K_DeepCast_35m_m2_023]|nr:lycopene cyclase family protein [Cyanobacteria bacterium K_DeepCast_35m_m2_023]
QTPWQNTYGIWGQEVDALGLQHLLQHRWSDTVSHFGRGARDPADPANAALAHNRDYGLFDKARLQQHWLERSSASELRWWRDSATAIEHASDHSRVTTASGSELKARLVIDASGHRPAFVRFKPTPTAVAGQAAYGVVARFSPPPIAPGQFVFMDYRCDHLSPAQRQEPPTFLYAMDLGDDVYFVEETSLALAPAMPFAVLKQRLQQRLQQRGAVIEQIQHEEFCLFPMNPPLPELRQRVVGFGGSGGMVHPASGFMVGSLLRRAPDLASTIATALEDSTTSGEQLATLAWQTLWPRPLQLKREFYRFGLQKLMGFDEQRLRHHFHAFFQLPDPLWYGFLTNTLDLGELAGAMARLFALAPWDVRAGLLLPAQSSAGFSDQLSNDDKPQSSS